VTCSNRPSSRLQRAQGDIGSTGRSAFRPSLQTRWSAEAWAQVRVEFRRALALRSELQRAGWFN